MGGKFGMKEMGNGQGPILELCFYSNVTMLRSGLCYRKSVCRLSVVCNV